MMVGDLSGRLYQGFWYQTRQCVTSMQLWAKALDAASIVSRTSGHATKSTCLKLIKIFTEREGCGKEVGDLHKWKNMKWKLQAGRN